MTTETGLFVGPVVTVQEILSRLGCSSRPGKKYFFPPPHGTPFQFFCRPISQQAEQAVVPGRFSLNIRLPGS
jgi:hypothetical protein